MEKEKIKRSELIKLISIGNYQFGKPIGNYLFSPYISVTHSKRTGRIRLIYEGENLIATLRPTDGLLALSLYGAKIILKKTKPPRLRVQVEKSVADFIKDGRNVFAKHVIKADPNIHPSDEVIVVTQEDELLGVGKAVLSGEEMIAFKNGVAVKIRKGIKENEKD
ncbi:MAG: PUA domain-containing protein [Candidatus Bathyarchaeia archaeon]